MLAADERQAVLEAFLAKGRLSSARLLDSGELEWGRSRKVVAAVEGAVALDGQRVTLRVGLCGRFPIVLPSIFVILSKGERPIPHVEPDGRICYRSGEGLLIDSRVPVQILEEAVEAAVQTLGKGMSGENWRDFVDELEAYWRHLAKSSMPESYVEPDGRLRAIDAGVNKRGALVYVADSIESVRAFGDQYEKPLSARRSLYVPLEASVLEERFDPLQFRSLSWTRSFVQRHLSDNNRRELQRLGIRSYPLATVVLGVPRSKGGRGLVGLQYHEVTGGHPLLRGCTPHEPLYFALERRDRAVATARAEGAVDVQKKHVVLAGCGSVGGHLALLLARTGIGRLTLIDPDKIAVENAFRHPLGWSAIRARKVFALKYEIKAKIPYIEVDTHDGRIEDVLQKPALDLEEVDLLVYAAGDPTLGLHLNERIHASAKGPALLFTWLEPYGLGGHALLTHTPAGGAGCFACLFDSPIRGEPRRNRADFAGPNQYFAKDVSGCATVYTPYADLDAVRTAELAARMTLDFLRGRAIGHPLLSWKEDSEAFAEAGFSTSPRYGCTEQELHEQRLLYVRETCPVCGEQA